MKAIRGALLGWYRSHRRDLPWRRSRDPYAIWVSEIMLQQTRVETVIPYYQRFLERFPDIDTLADADREEVYQLWSGLGYYSRARNLHTTAQIISRDKGGRLPEKIDALRSLPGIGRYTAGAVSSIAFDLPEPVVDGNVARVLARLFGIREVVTHKAVVERLWREAALLVRGPHPGDLNQSLMELGATVCTARTPACRDCPLARFCKAHRQKRTASIPARPPKKSVPRIELAVAWLERRGRVLAVRRPQRGPLAGLWDLPGGDLRPGETPPRGIRRLLRERVGLSAGRLRRLGEVEHEFTHRKLRLYLFVADGPKGRVHLDGFDEHAWLSPNRLADLAQAALTRKALRMFRQAARLDAAAAPGANGGRIRT